MEGDPFRLKYNLSELGPLHMGVANGPSGRENEVRGFLRARARAEGTNP